jgi:hypothetical protein
VGEVGARSREEGGLELRVTARPRGSKAPYQLDDAVEPVGFEGEDPLVIAEPESARRVGEDVGELAAGLAVLAQQGLPLSRVEEVPLRRPHEGIDA